jgi:hypothetical protein
VGYCGLDRQRRPISGDEIRACWESRPGSAEAPATAAVPSFVRTPVPRREFIEVVEPAPVVAERPSRQPQANAAEPDLVPPLVTPRWSLWEDAET